MVYFGYGGIAGAVIGAYFVKLFDHQEYLFLSLYFTLVKLFIANPEPTKKEVYNPLLYSLIGFGIGIFSGMLGVGIDTYDSYFGEFSRGFRSKKPQRLDCFL